MSWVRFQHTAARRRLGTRRQQQPMGTLCFNTQPPEGGWEFPACVRQVICSFNTQPPEGGWVIIDIHGYNIALFQHTAARRRLAGVGKNTAQILLFQHTAARRRLVTVLRNKKSSNNVSTHSRPKAAGKLLDARHASPFVSTHSRPKAAGCMKLSVMARRCRFQHTAARRRLGTYSHGTHPHQEFQHTAARRRLAEKQEAYWRAFEFQHTAARRRLGSKFWCRNCPLCFNTQPPEGGWKGDFHSSQPSKVSTHSRPKAAGYQHKYIASPEAVSTHSRPKAAGI